jgi:hypothetical protein
MEKMTAHNNKHHEHLLNMSDESFEAFRLSGDRSRLMEAISHLITYTDECQPSDDMIIGPLAFKLARCGLALYERSRAPLDVSQAISNAYAAITRIPDQLSKVGRAAILAERACVLSRCLVSQGLSKDCGSPNSLNKGLQTVEDAAKELETLEQTNNKGYCLLLQQKALCQQLLWDRNGKNVEDLASSLNLTFKVLNWPSYSLENDERVKILGEMAGRLLRAHTYEVRSGQRLPRGAIPEPVHEVSLCDMAASYLSMAESLDVERDITKLDTIISVLEYLHNMPEASQRPLLRKLSFILQSNVQRFKRLMRVALTADITAHAEKYFGLPRDAAAAATEAGADAFTALQILEEGRHITGMTNLNSWKDLMVARSPNELEAEKYRQLRQDLDRLIEQGAPHQERKKSLAAMETFEKQSPWTQIITRESLTCLASEGPIVIINISNVRSDAYIITTSGVRSVWLPSLKELDASELSWEVQWRLAQDVVADPEVMDKELHFKLKGLYDYIWRRAMKPILDELGFLRRQGDIAEWPRVCWIPTGILSLYPVGFSGIGLGEPGNAFNRVISTYAPSIKAMLVAKNHSTLPRIPRTAKDPTTAVLAMENTAGHPKKDVWEHPDDVPDPAPWVPLTFAKEEALIVEKYFPATFVRFQPTRQEVLDKSSHSCSLIHLSCHGWNDFINPSKSMLLFGDTQPDPLLVEQIGKATILSKVVVVSACWTANSGLEGLQDEPNHITAALFAAGFQAVVGSLWSVRQSVAVSFMEELYQYLALHARGDVDIRIVAEAVHVASMKVAQGFPNNSFWSPFICYGI